MKASGGLVCQGVIDGENGKNGYNAVAVPLYRRSSSELNDGNRPSGTLTYTFSTGKLTGPSSYFNGWSQNIPTASANTKLYVIMAVARSQSDTDDIAASDWSTPVEYVADGMNSAPVFIYKRAESVSDKPANGAVYTFATGVLAGTLNGWSTNIPATDNNHYPCWVRQAMAVSRDTTDVINASEWSNATKLVEDGVSIKSANVWYALTQSNTTVPVDNAFTLDNFPTTLNAGYYVWECTKIVDSNNNTKVTGKMCLGATTDFLSGTEVYAVSTNNSTAPADSSFGTTYNKTKGSYLWTATRVQYTDETYAYLNKKCVGYWGEDGLPGGNTATIFLYRRSNAAITALGTTLPTLYYKFSTKRLYTDAACTTLFTGQGYWYQDIPSGSAQIYVTTAVVYSTTDVDSIDSDEWVSPVQFTENGQKGDKGDKGDHGINSSPIFLYKRSSGNITAHGITNKLYYKFADGKLYNNSGATTEATQANLNYWSRSVPADDGNPCYITQASALSNGDTDEIATSDWSTPVKYVKDGEKGDNAVTYAIVFTNAWAKRNKSGHVNGALVGKAYKIEGDTRTPLKSARIDFGYQGGLSANTTTDDNGSFTDSNWFDDDWNDVNTCNSATCIYASIIIDSTAVCTEYINIAFDGSDGNSIKGDTGRMYYLAGEFPKNAPYTRTSALCPVVYYATEWWYLDADSATSSDIPSDSSAKWKKLEKYGTVITDAIFVKQFAQFGAAVITCDWLISVHGTIGGVVYGGSVEEPDNYNGRAAYTYFDPAYPEGYEQLTLPIIADEVDKAHTTAWTKITNNFQLTAGTYKFKVRCYVNSSDTVHVRLFQEEGTQDAYYIGGTTSDTAVTLEKTIVISSNRNDFNLRAATNEDGEIGYIQSIEIEPVDTRFVPNYAVDLKTGRTYQSDAHIKGTITSVGENTKIVIEDGIIKFFGTWNFPNIVLGVSEDGGAVLNFYDRNGNFKYGLGPNEIIYTKSQAESMTLRYYNIDTGATDCTSIESSDIVTIYRFVYKSVYPDYTKQLYKYLAKISANVYGGTYVNNDDAQGKKFNGKIIKQGYSTPLADNNIYAGGLVMLSSKPGTGIIKYKSNVLNGTSVDELDYRGYNIMQDSDYDRTKDGQVYRYNTKGYDSTEAFYWNFSYADGAVVYNGVYGSWWYLNLCTDPADNDTLVDPVYYFNLQCIDSNGNTTGFKTLFINKSKLSALLQAAGYSL